MTDHNRLVRLLAHLSASRGEFTLASGKTSSLYIDARMTTMTPEGQILIGSIGLRTLHRAGWDVQAVGGMTMGADPIAYAISYASADSKTPLRAFTVRKEPKVHGKGKQVEGPFRSGDRVALIEDVITTGGSALRAAEAVESAGGKIAGILSLVDREEGGREALEVRGYQVISLTTASEIISAISD